MNIRTKLTLGIGLLFLFIMALSWISILKFNNLSNDSRNILRDNHNSLNYSMAMLRALESWGTDAKAAEHFRENLVLQQRNVTENGEGDFTDALSEEFERLGTSPDPAVFAQARKDIYAIIHLNMDAIARKSAVAERTASDAKIWLTGMGTFSVLIALLLLLNLPGNIANPIRELTQSIEAIAAQQYEQRIHFKSGSEFGTVADSFNVMAEKLEEYHASKVSALLMEKKRIDTLIDNMRDPVVGLDETNKVLFVNNEALIITGLSREQVVGRPAQDVAVHNDLIRLLIRDLVRNETSVDQRDKEPIKIYAGGKESYFEQETVKITISPTGEQRKQDIGHVILLKDITSFKELDAAKTNFIATVSHELKTPLSSIKMSVQLLNKPATGVLNRDQEQLLESIEEDSNRLLKITGELLNLTQVESGNIQLNIKQNNPLEIVDYAVEAVTFPAERKGIRILRQLPDHLPDIHADADKTAWVLVNFLTNAIRYSDEDSEISIILEPFQDKIKFSVTDAGPGIDVAYVDKIFDRYFQVPGSAKTGTGLGLAICKEFIEAQQGSIGVSSKAGSGSTFYFII